MAHHEAHREEWEQQQARHRAVRTKYLEELLCDIPALQARDWTDEEDLASELVPLLLARLAVESPQG